MHQPVGKLLLFGATGDLAQRMLLPSLYGLHVDGLFAEEAIVPGKDAQASLEHYVWECAPDRYPEGLPPDVLKTVRHELDLIRTMKYAPYFLTVFSIVRFARSQGILCQGRGSAANSAVCYILGITSIDPSTNDLL